MKAEALAPEWDFTVPLARVAPDALADAFRQHGAAPFGADYADALARLSSAAVDGFLVGSADLVAFAGDRWWVADWKSNRLGNDAAAYTPEALEATMLEHHYGLQLHLYTLGLHRFLRSRLGAAYDYEACVGGAAYVFLRGVGEGGAGAPDHPAPLDHPARPGPPPLSPPGCADLTVVQEGDSATDTGAGRGGAGLFRHRPSAAIIEALDGLLAPAPSHA